MSAQSRAKVLPIAIEGGTGRQGSDSDPPEGIAVLALSTACFKVAAMLSRTCLSIKGAFNSAGDVWSELARRDVSGSSSQYYWGAGWMPM